MQIQKRLEEALLASEDQNFWHHSGVDFRALGRAAWGNFKNQKVESGASTLTMQLARMLFLEDQKHDAWYKIRQIWDAWRLDEGNGPSLADLSKRLPSKSQTAYD